MSSSIFIGRVLGAETANPIEKVKLQIFNSDNILVQEKYSDKHGRWKIETLVDCSRIIFSHPKFVEKTLLKKDLGPTITVRLLENELIGYQPKLWYKPGDKVEVFVHSPDEFQASLERHGLIKSPVLNMGEQEAQMQNVPNEDFVSTGMAWNKSFEYTIPEEAKPGLFSVQLTSQGHAPFAIPMVVTSPQPSARLLVLASTNNWQTYNIWGGRNRYRNFLDIPGKETDNLKAWKIPKYFGGTRLKNFLNKLVGNKPKPWPSWMFEKLSVNRPCTNCSLEENTPFQPFTNHLAAGEWRVLAWLEKKNIPYDIISGFELHNHGSILEDYSGIILSTHCEYWSREMFDSVRFYHENKKLWLINLSGNSIYREVGYFEDGSLQCKSLFFEKSVSDETKLIGVRYTDVDYGTSAPYKIIDPDHWVFNGITYASDTPYFGGLSLNQHTPNPSHRFDPGRPGASTGLKGMGASGWETDKITATAPKNTKVVAKGMNPKGGADMIVKDPAGTCGGLFSASSITFGGSLLIDHIASSVTLNVLKRVLQSGKAS